MSLDEPCDTESIEIARGSAKALAAAADFHFLHLPQVDLIDCFAHPEIWPIGDDDVLLLARERQQLIGTLFGSAPHRDAGGGHVWTLAVAPQRRRQGVGRRLIHAFALIAADAGTDVVWVDPVEGPDELALIGYYMRLGWQDRTGFAEGKVDYRHEQMCGTVESILEALEGPRPKSS